MNRCPGAGLQVWAREGQFKCPKCDMWWGTSDIDPVVVPAHEKYNQPPHFPLSATVLPMMYEFLITVKYSGESVYRVRESLLPGEAHLSAARAKAKARAMFIAGDEEESVSDPEASITAVELSRATAIQAITYGNQRHLRIGQRVHFCVAASGTEGDGLVQGFTLGVYPRILIKPDTDTVFHYSTCCKYLAEVGVVEDEILNVF